MSTLLLINIGTGNNSLKQEVNVHNTLELGNKQKEEFEADGPDALYKPLKRVVVPMTANRRTIDVGGQRVVDTGNFYARALGLHDIQRDGTPSVESIYV